MIITKIKKNESSDRQSSNKDSSDEEDDDDDDDDDERQDSNNNSSTFFPKKNNHETYEHKPEPEPSLEDIIEKKKHMLYEFERLKKEVFLYLKTSH